MNILLFGKNGQLGWELQRALSPLGNLTALGSDSVEYCGDFRDPQGIIATIRKLRPDIIVNACAYTAVDKAESEIELAQLINAETVGAIAKEAQASGAWLVHYSTDYVFAGDGEQPWLESDRPAPLNVYGKSKLAGEQAIQKYCVKHLIFRTSWVYATKGDNFAKKMLRLAKEHSELSVINDQHGAPTGADLLADCSAHAIATAWKNAEVAGLYHLTASGSTTWYDYASLVFSEMRKAGEELTVKKLHPIPGSDYPTPAARPLNSRLNTDRFQRTFGLILPDWQHGVRRMLIELAALQAL